MQNSRHYPPAKLLPLLLLLFIDAIGTWIVYPIFAPLLLDPSSPFLDIDTSLQVRSTILGLLLAAYPLAEALGGPLLGALSDCTGRRPVLVLAITGSLLCYIVAGIGIVQRSLALLFVSRLLGGLLAANSPVAYSAIADSTHVDERRRYFNYLTLAGTIGGIFGPLLGGLLADGSIIAWFSHDLPFWVAAALCLINLYVMLPLFKETLDKEFRHKFELKQRLYAMMLTLTDRHIRSLQIVSFFTRLGWSCFIFFIQVYLTLHFHVGPSGIGYVFTCFALLFALIQFLLPKIHIAWTHLSLIRISLAFMIPALLIVLLAPNIYLLLALLIPSTVAVVLYRPTLFAMLTHQASKNAHGGITGVQGSFQAIAGTLAPSIAGAVVHLALVLPLILASAYYAASLLSTLSIRE